MHFDGSLFVCALGLALVIESILWTLFPHSMRKSMLRICQLPDSHLRATGLGGLALGVGIIWIARFLL